MDSECIQNAPRCASDERTEPSRTQWMRIIVAAVVVVQPYTQKNDAPFIVIVNTIISNLLHAIQSNLNV